MAHPDLVPACVEVFDKRLGDRPNQLHHQRPDGKVTVAQLLDVSCVAGKRTEAGLRSNVDVGLPYLEAWLRGTARCTSTT